jgi:hypothetical protein
MLALALTACSGGSSVNIADLVTKVQQTCGFATSWEEIAKVIATMVSGFDPNLGSGATVAVGIGNSVVDGICGAVKNKISASQPQALLTPTDTTVVVNGVPVKGRMVANEKK